MRSTSLALCLAACEVRTAEEADWYADAESLDVEETVSFTDVPYDFPEDDADGIAALQGPVFPIAAYTTAFAPGDAPASDCVTEEDDDLPIEVEGIVTVHPRFYYKTDGCYQVDPNAPEGDEKYYGSFFLEDRTGGVFVLGDSKVAHFDLGDRVRIRIRGARTAFELDTVVNHDVVAVTRGPFPVHYEVATDTLGDADVARVRRVSGTVTQSPTGENFGEMLLLYCPGDDTIPQDDGFTCEGGGNVTFSVGVDQELTKRGVTYPVGTAVEATGPVIYSYQVYQVVVTRIGQLRQDP